MNPTQFVPELVSDNVHYMFSFDLSCVFENHGGGTNQLIFYSIVSTFNDQYTISNFFKQNPPPSLSLCKKNGILQIKLTLILPSDW